MRLVKYMVKRIGWGLVSLFAFLFLMFVIIEILIPGDIVSPLRQFLTGQEMDELRASLGLDRPLPVRFWTWLQVFVRGQLDITTFGPGSGSTVFTSLPETLIVFTLGIAVSWSIGTWLGRVTAWRRSDILGPSMSFLGVIAYTVFPPFLAFALGEWLQEPLRNLRAAVVSDHRGLLWREAPITEQRAMVDVVLIVAVVTIVVLVAVRLLARRRIHVPGLVKAAVIVGLVFGVLAVLDIRDYALDVIFQAAIPLLSFTILTFGEFLLIAQAAMVASSGDDYVLTARAKGLSERRVRDRHVGRNANLVILTRLAVSLPYMLTGLVIIEAAVGWPGIGTFLFNAIGSQDMPVVMSGLAIIGGFTLMTRLVLDFVVALGDPRITGVGPAEIRL